MRIRKANAILGTYLALSLNKCDTRNISCFVSKQKISVHTRCSLIIVFFSDF